MARPGFVLEVDERTPPLLVHQGEGFRLQKFPLGSRVIYPPDSLPAAARPAEPHPARARPSPRLRAAQGAAHARDEAHDRDRRHLDPAAADADAPTSASSCSRRCSSSRPRQGVEDIKLYHGERLHRRMTADEIKHAVGERVFRSFYPKDLKNHDAEDPDNLAYVGKTDQGEEVEINKRAVESDLLIYVNINLVAMDGGHKSVPVGLASYRSAASTTTTSRRCCTRKSYMDPRPARARSTTRASAWASCSSPTASRSSRSRPR